jgi:peptidoglycan/xylan/chitin deacetylase (PgdA/CDA1 family)
MDRRLAEDGYPMVNPSRPGFVISLDFELAWGMRDLRWAPAYRGHLEGAIALVPRTLQLFESAGVEATWAIVGALGLPNLEALFSAYVGDPNHLREVVNGGFLPVGQSPELDRLHFAPDLVERVMQTPGQTIGSHTFLHTTWAGPASSSALQADLASLQALDRNPGRALVFPRNLYDAKALSVAASEGFVSFRGVPTSRSWSHDIRTFNRPWRRALRLSQAYASTRQAYTSVETDTGLVNVRASRFLRPPGSRRFMNEQMVRVVKAEMRNAARLHQTYHLWWHPHNHGARPEAASAMLEPIVNRWRELNDEHGWPTLSMDAVA